MAHKISNREIGWIALAVVTKLLPGLKVRNDWSRDVLATVAAAMKDSFDHLFMLPCQAAEEDRHVVSLCGCEGALYRFLELAHSRQTGFGAKTRSFSFYAGLDFHFEVCLHDLGYGHLRLLCAHRSSLRVNNGVKWKDYICPFIPWKPCASCLKKYLITRWSL